MKKRVLDNKSYLAGMLFTVILMVYVCFSMELKWKLILLPQEVLLLVSFTFEWMESVGLNKYAKLLRKIHKVVSRVFAVIASLVLIGILLGVWDL